MRLNQIKNMNPSELTDEELVSQSLDNLDTFGVLVDRYESKLKRYILRLGNFSEMEAEEVLQESFIKAWKNLNSFDPNLRFSAWIYRITHNEVISQFRKAKSRGEDQQVQIDPEIFEAIPVEIDFVADFDQTLNAKKIQSILSHMTPMYKEVLILRFFEDLSYEEMVDVLRKPSGTIATLLNRAKKEFKQITQKHAKQW